MHPYFSQEVLLRMARENGLQVMAFSNFGPISYVELDLATNEETLLVKEAVTSIAAAHNKTPAQVLLRWAVQRGTVAIPKSARLERLIENISVFDFNLSHAEMKAIDALNTNTRYNDPVRYAERIFGQFCPIYH